MTTTLQPHQEKHHMATARPRLLTQISGTLASLEFAQHPSLILIRKRKKPKTLVSPARIEAQRLHAYKLTIWQTMIHPYPLRVQDWHLYATTHPLKNRLGQRHTISPFQCYLKLFKPFDNAPNFTMYAPLQHIPVPSIPTLTAAITAPSTFLIHAQFTPEYYPYTVCHLHYSDPLTPTTNLTRLRHHHLGTDFTTPYGPHDLNFTARCIRLGRAWLPGQQIIITLTPSIICYEPSPPTTYTATVAAP